jgi:hypothetical protein
MYRDRVRVTAAFLTLLVTVSANLNLLESEQFRSSRDCTVPTGIAGVLRRG